MSDVKITDLPTATTIATTDYLIKDTGAATQKITAANLFKNIYYPLVSKTTTYTADALDETILCSTAGGAWEMALPTAAGITGKKYIIIKTSADFNALTINPAGSETIDGATTYLIYLDGEGITIQSDGTNWAIIATKASKWCDYASTSTIVAAASYTEKRLQIQKNGKVVNVAFEIRATTSNATERSFTLPIPIVTSGDWDASAGGVYGIGTPVAVYDNATDIGIAFTQFITTTKVKIYSSYVSATFANSAFTFIAGTFSYQAA